MKEHAGLVAIVGAPNAGKSTLVNTLVGQKISIVTPKVQTTRFCVRGVMSEKNNQAVLIDTPGIFESDRQFEQSLVREAYEGLKGVDAIVLMVDVSKAISDEVHTLIRKILSSKIPQALVLNKIDKLPKIELLAITKALAKQYALPEVFMISAKSGDGLVALKKWVFSQLPTHPFYFPEDQLSDVSMQALAAELTREKLFLQMHQELPYHLTVVPEQWEEKPRSVAIKQAIVVTRENHKKMIIGNKGENVKRIGEMVRKELESILNKKVHLTLFVKVDTKWQEKTIRLGQAYEG